MSRLKAETSTEKTPAESEAPPAAAEEPTKEDADSEAPAESGTHPAAGEPEKEDAPVEAPAAEALAGAASGDAVTNTTGDESETPENTEAASSETLC